jgi:DNA gyrase subunit A
VKLTTKTGPVVCGIVLKEDERVDGELVIMSQKGQVIKLPLKDVPTLGRQTQGVRVMKMRTGDTIASVVFV